jgi:hypothetical protein
MKINKIKIIKKASRQSLPIPKNKVIQKKDKGYTKHKSHREIYE